MVVSNQGVPALSMEERLKRVEDNASVFQQQVLSMLAAFQPQPTSFAPTPPPCFSRKRRRRELDDSISLHPDSSLEDSLGVSEGKDALLEDPTHPVRRVEHMDAEAAETEPSLGGKERLLSNM